MDAIIEVVEGDDIASATECIFCGISKGVSQFGLIVGKKWNGHSMKFFGICESHLAKIEALLTGQTDINKIYSDKATSSTPFLRLRGKQ